MLTKSFKSRNLELRLTTLKYGHMVIDVPYSEYENELWNSHDNLQVSPVSTCKGKKRYQGVAQTVEHIQGYACQGSVTWPHIFYSCKEIRIKLDE